MVRLSKECKTFSLGASTLDLRMIRSISQSGSELELADKSSRKVEKCRDYLDRKLQTSDHPYYGINTGFGYLQHIRINRDQITQLQYNLLRSHASGTGENVPKPLVALMILLKVHSLAQGHSGIQLQTVRRLLDFYNSGYLPQVYTLGSLGASGDLAPLSHLSLPLIGEGKMTDPDGNELSSGTVLDLMGWSPVTLRAKEGLALINGTQFMSAYAVHCLLVMEHLLHSANLIGALSCDAFDCSREPFHPAIHAIRPHPGQRKVAAIIDGILAASPIAGQCKSQVQDPYSFRCIPQVHGASWDVFDQFRQVMECEINSVTDNPSIFPDEDLILSGGNFHGQPLALGLDALGNALAELASISERRTYQLISGQRGLPAFLVKDPGLHSGLMIPQYTAAGIVSQNKQLCSPASIDSIVSSNGQEDHVSMGANAATKCLRIVENVERVLAIELLTAAQALEFRRPMETAPVLEKLISKYREQVPFMESDRILSEDIKRSILFLKNLNISEYADDITDL